MKNVLLEMETKNRQEEFLWFKSDFSWICLYYCLYKEVNGGSFIG